MTVDEAKRLLAQQREFKARALPDGVCAGEVVRVWAVDEHHGRLHVHGEPLWFGDQGFFSGFWPADELEAVGDDKPVTM